MGNNACCTANHTDRCCKGAMDRPDGGAPVSKPLPSCEVMGVEPSPPPGIGSMVDIGPDSNQKEENANNQGFGGDEAAGKTELVSYKDGSTYTGQMANGMRHGSGVRKSANGEYEGQWEADLQHGKGTQKWSDGRKYEGQFESGKFSGEGRMIWSTQKGLLVYEGQYKDDLKHGNGKFVWADGRTYEGEWCCGKRHGRGQYINARNEQKVGYWLDDKFDRWEADTTNMNGSAKSGN